MINRNNEWIQFKVSEEILDFILEGNVIAADGGSYAIALGMYYKIPYLADLPTTQEYIIEGTSNITLLPKYVQDNYLEIINSEFNYLTKTLKGDNEGFVTIKVPQGSLVVTPSNIDTSKFTCTVAYSDNTNKLLNDSYNYKLS